MTENKNLNINKFLEEHLKAFLRIAFRYLNDRQYAEDAVLMASVKIFNHYKQAQQENKNLVHWAKVIVKNESINLAKKNKRSRISGNNELTLMNLPSCTNSDEDIKRFEKDYNVAMVYEEIRSILTDFQFQVFFMRHFENKKVSEIKEIFSISRPEIITKTLDNAKRKIRRNISQKAKIIVIKMNEDGEF